MPQVRQCKYFLLNYYSKNVRFIANAVPIFDARYFGELFCFLILLLFSTFICNIQVECFFICDNPTTGIC